MGLLIARVRWACSKTAICWPSRYILCFMMGQVTSSACYNIYVASGYFLGSSCYILYRRVCERLCSLSAAWIGFIVFFQSFSLFLLILTSYLYNTGTVTIYLVLLSSRYVIFLQSSRTPLPSSASLFMHSYITYHN